jgi:hypothetical protein
MINDLPNETAFNLRGVEREEECPLCGEWITYGDQQDCVICPSCQNTLGIDVDADFVNGSWRNLTHLYVPK